VAGDDDVLSTEGTIMSINLVQFQQGLSMVEFMQEYGTEAKAYRALYKSRWPHGFRCPACGDRRRSRFLRSRQVYYQCRSCRHQTMLLSGTIPWGDGRRMPHRLAAKSPTQSAATLCHWIEQLRTRDPDLLEWLLNRWLYASEKEFGRIRIGASEQVRWQQLPATPDVTPVMERKVFKRERDSRRADWAQVWGRIRCGNPADGFIRRDVRAVRWVMTWTCALLP
jgi:hypothetical protein